MFAFDKNSVIVGAWVTLIQNGEKTINDVPKLWNLREVVTKVLKERKEDK